MARLRQVSFAGGEIGPNLYGRSDHDRYAGALRKCQGWIPDPYGGISNRPGTEYLGDCNDDVPTRLIPFIYSDGEAYIVEFQQSWLRVWYRGGLIDLTGASDYVLAHASVPKLTELEWTQSGDILTIVEPGGAGSVQQLLRNGHNDWEVRNYPYTRADVGAPSKPTALGYAAAFVPDIVGVPATGYTPKNWEWAVAAVTLDGIEGLATSFVPPDPVVCHPSRQDNELEWVPPVGLPAARRYHVFRGQNGILGFVGAIDSGLTSPSVVKFFDDGHEPDYAIQPMGETNPFLYDKTGASTNYPSCAAYHDQRIFFGGGVHYPQRIRGSALGDYYTFDRPFPTFEDNALEFDIGSLKAEQVRHMVSIRDLIVLTDSAAYRVNGGQQGPITPLAPHIKPQSFVGASKMKPVVVDNSVLYVQERGAAILDMAYDFSIGGYRSNELSELAPHLLDGFEVVDMAFQRQPYRTLWIARDDGLLLGLTYIREAGVIGWHKHELADAGQVVSVAVIPEENGDRVYVCTKRGSTYHMERFAYGHTYEDRFSSTTAEGLPEGKRSGFLNDDGEYVWTSAGTDKHFAWFLDFAVMFNGRNHELTTMRADATPYTGTYDEGDTVDLIPSGNTFAGGDIGKLIVFDPKGEAGGPYKAEITAYTSPLLVKAIIHAGGIGAGYQNTAVQDWAWGVIDYVGLTHLASRDDVYCIADGVPVGPLSVSAGGAVSLPGHASVAIFGLLYLSELELLDLADGGAEVRTRSKSVTAIYFEVDEPEGLYAGEDTDNLDPAQVDAENLVEVLITHSFNTGGRAVVRQTLPLPVRLAAVTREVEMGE